MSPFNEDIIARLLCTGNTIKQYPHLNKIDFAIRFLAQYHFPQRTNPKISKGNADILMQRF